jgi:hypothetical protein
MGQSFIACDREQSFLMPPDVRDWLPEGHLAWFVLDAVAAMDLTAFYAAYREDGRCRPAYEPSMMVMEFPRFRGHLIAGPFGPAARIDVHAVNPAVFA